MPPSGAPQILFSSSRFEVQRWSFPGGIERDIVVHPGAVVVLPLLAPDRIVLIHNLRYAAGRTLQELPAGTLEPGETPATCAARELEEETGYAAGRMEPLGAFYTCPGICTEWMHAFVATDLTATTARPDPGEHIRPEVVSWTEVRRRVRDGTIEDAKTLACLALHTWRDEPS